MRQWPKILFAVLAVLLLGNSLGDGAQSSGTGSAVAVIYSAEENSTHSTHPFDRPNLFNIYHQAESAGSLVSNVPGPHASGDEREDTVEERTAEAVEQQRETIQLKAYAVTGRPPADLKLIFPHHTFL